MNINVFLYEPERVSNLDLDNIKNYLIKKFNNKEQLKIEIKKNPSKNRLSLAEKFAKIRVTDINKDFKENEPFPSEIEFEKKVLKGEILPTILYDGFEMQNIFRELIPRDKLNLKNIHIIFTNRLVGTFSEEEASYHARTNILGIPSIISLSGIVEAPAKPREFYLLKQKIPVEILKEKFKERFIDYDDARLTDIVKGFVLQAIFYQLFGEGFCENKNCRLFNAHWQEELINAQLNDKLCEKHDKMLEKWVNKFS